MQNTTSHLPLNNLHRFLQGWRAFDSPFLVKCHWERQLHLLEVKPYDGSLLSCWKCGVFMAGGMAEVLGILPYFSCMHDWTQRKKQVPMHLSLPLRVTWLLCISWVLQFSTKYSKPQPTKPNIPLKCPPQWNHTHNGHFFRLHLPSPYC